MAEYHELLYELDNERGRLGEQHPGWYGLISNIDEYPKLAHLMREAIATLHDAANYINAEEEDE